MKFRCERDSLVEVVTTAGRAVSTRSATSMALGGVRLTCHGNTLSVVGTDLDLTIHAVTEAIGLEDGVCVAPGRLVSDIVRALEPGAVTVESTGENVEISAARSHFSLRTFPSEEFPSLPDPEPPSTTLPTAALFDALRQVVRAASSDDARPLLTGVLVASEGDGVRLVATDSYRLAPSPSCNAWPHPTASRVSRPWASASGPTTSLSPSAPSGSAAGSSTVPTRTTGS